MNSNEELSAIGVASPTPPSSCHTSLILISTCVLESHAVRLRLICGCLPGPAQHHWLPKYDLVLLTFSVVGAAFAQPDVRDATGFASETAQAVEALRTEPRQPRQAVDRFCAARSAGPGVRWVHSRPGRCKCTSEPGGSRAFASCVMKDTEARRKPGVSPRPARLRCSSSCRCRKGLCGGKSPPSVRVKASLLR